MKDRRFRNRRRGDLAPEERNVLQERLLEAWLERKAGLVRCAWCHAVKPLAKFPRIGAHRQCRACIASQAAAVKRRKES